MKKTILFIHGMFQNPKSWDKWIAFFEAKGYNCVAPAWPFHEGEPAMLRENPPAGLGELPLEDILAEFERVASAMPEKPILIGHSVGGLVVQLLVNLNIGSAGVCIDSVAPNAMLSFDWGFFKNSALITNPLKGDEPFYQTPKDFRASFTNTMSEDDAMVAYNEYAMHDSRNVLRDCMGPTGHVDLDLPHAPLLFIGGSEDQIIPPELNEKNAKAYTDEASVADFKEFAGRGHYICGQPGWEEVADYISNWIGQH